MNLMRRVGAGVLGAALAVGFWLAFRPDPAPADGRVHIRYWEKWTGVEDRAMRRVVDAFNRRQDRIVVEMLSVSNVNQKMLLATAGGDPPDLAGLWEYDLVAFADYNALRPLDDLMARDGVKEADYVPAYWDLCRHRGRMFGLPTTPASMALHWNRTMFREAGLDPDKPPATLEEMAEMSKRLTRHDRDGKLKQTGFMPSEPGWWHWSWGYYFGGSLWDGQARSTAPSPANLRAYQWVKDYVDREGSQRLQAFQSGFGNFSSPENAFMNGKVAMVHQGVWMASFINSHAPGLDWDAAPFPYPTDRPDLKGNTLVETDVLTIPTGGKHPEEAWEFVKWVQSQEGMEMLCEGQWKPSPLRRVSPGFYRRHRNKRIKLFYDLAAGKTFSWPRVGIWREWNDEMRNAFEKIWSSGEDPESALGYVDARIQPKLDRYFEEVRRSELAQAALAGAAH